MSKQISKLETIRRDGRTQVEAQRVSILDAAESLFLEKGLEQTNMKDIAAGAGITRVSLYRYFPDRDPIAFEIAVRMLKRIAVAVLPEMEPNSLEAASVVIIGMIDQFYPLRDAYRYLGMFDHLYGDSYPNETLAKWYKAQIFELGWSLVAAPDSRFGVPPGQVAMITNSTMSFLQKMAVRGDLMAGEQEVSLDEQLAYFKDMVIGYFDQMARKEDA